MTERVLILVVDDEPDILNLNRLILEREGWQVVTAGDGVDAIQKAFDRSPDLIVLDVMMPRMNGYQVCRLLKSDQLTAGIPIVICSVLSLDSEKLYAHTSGADHYLTKPFDHHDLVRLVRAILDSRPGNRPPRRSGVLAARHTTSTDSILSDVNRLLDRRLMELTILQHVADALAGTLDLDGVLGIVLQSIVRDLGYSGGMIFLAGARGVLDERLARGEPLLIDPAQYPVFGQVLAQNRVVILGVDELLNDTPVGFSARINAASTILVPIQAKGSPIGLLVVESTAAAVDSDHRDFLMTLANQSGLAIENANLYARTLQLSITDGLTDIFNYRHFYERLEMEIARSRRYNVPLGLLLIDIDRFKSFNDRFGHLLGDQVLKAVAHTIGFNTRDVDVVARYGGEEFCVILQEIGGAEIEAFAERIRVAVAAVPIEVPGRAAQGVTVSVGAAVSQGGEPDAHEFIRRADAALYRAKDAGRDRVCLWAEAAGGESPAPPEKGA